MQSEMSELISHWLPYKVSRLRVRKTLFMFMSNGWCIRYFKNHHRVM
jgi:hypothetical protein